MDVLPNDTLPGDLNAKAWVDLLVASRPKDEVAKYVVSKKVAEAKKGDLLTEENKVRFRTDIKAYAWEILGIDLTPDQIEIAESIIDNKFTLVKASHAVGKTLLSAVVASWWYDCWDRHIVYITAPTWDQALGLTFKEIRTRRLSVGLVPDKGKVWERGWLRDNDPVARNFHYIRAINAATPEGMQGEHSAAILVIIEEGVGVRPEIWSAVMGLMTSPSCVVPGTIVSAPGVQAVTSRGYEGDVIRIETASRNTTVTENHPVLTPKGWVSAGMLQQGDYVFSTLQPERVSSRFQPDDYQVPTRVEDVFRTFHMTGGTHSIGGETITARDFHGDGRANQVDVVFPQSFLRNELLTLLQKEGVQLLFIDGPELSEPLDGVSTFELTAFSQGSSGNPASLTSHIESMFQPSGSVATQQCIGITTESNTGSVEEGAYGITRNAELLSQLRGTQTAVNIVSDNFGGVVGEPTPLQHLSFSPSPEGHTPSAESGRDGLSVDPKLAAEINGASSSDIFSDQILSIRRLPYSGQVYNLQTKNGWFFSDGIITHNCRILAIGNPTDESTEFGAKASSPSWNVISISALDHPNIEWQLRTGYELGNPTANPDNDPGPVPAAVSLDWVRDMMMAGHVTAIRDRDTRLEDEFWFVDIEEINRCVDFRVPADTSKQILYKPDAEFQGRVLGQFPTASDRQVIPRAWIEGLRPQAIPKDEDIPPEIGADIARYGVDRTVLLARRGPCALRGQIIRQMDNLLVADAIRDMAEAISAREHYPAKSIPIKIDVTGNLGTGPYDLLKSWGYNVYGINASSKASKPESFPNRRSELWFAMRERVRLAGLDLSRLDPDFRSELEKELTLPQYRVDLSGRKVVEDKDQMRRRTEAGRSPDLADAANLAYSGYDKRSRDARRMIRDAFFDA